MTTHPISALDDAWAHLKEAKDIFAQVAEASWEPHERGVHRGAWELVRECDRLMGRCDEVQDHAELAA